METRCRLCAECSANQLSILEDLAFCSKIIQLFQIKVSVEDNLPTSVCHICYNMVEKTWDFKDRIQKAQAVLTELVNSINAILTPTESLETPSTLHTQTNSQTVVSTHIGVVELDYIDKKDVIKCDFNLSDHDFSDGSEKAECKSKSLRTSKGKLRKNSKRKLNCRNLVVWSDIEFEMNEDGSISPKSEMHGWDTYLWTCCDCQLTFSLSEDLKEHYATTHNSITRYLCADCPKVYSKYSTFLT
ncbi:hypothetical protein NQ314_018540, partial [Rhamnusium bicolor]